NDIPFRTAMGQKCPKRLRLPGGQSTYEHMAGSCHQRTHAAQQRAWSFVGTGDRLAAAVEIRKANGGIAVWLCEPSHAPPGANRDSLVPQSGNPASVADEVIQ